MTTFSVFMERPGEALATLGMTGEDIHDTLDAMEPVVQKCHVLLTGSALVNIEPVDVGDDWKDAFSFAWCEGRSRG